ncbi:MAG: TIGR01777 family oxidoreductase [Bdellovibrionales bacterium]|nr:TIGR01777 family oxidoreductase [Bdellovibrionales bacterium]
MKVILFGATGFIGPALASDLTRRGHTVITSDVRKDPDWNKKIADADAVINLGGAPIFGPRWSKQYKQLIRDSRVESTQKIVEALAKARLAGGKVATLVNASAIGYYGPHGDENLQEGDAVGHDFLAGVCAEWEKAALAAQAHGIRVVCARFGVVLGREGGALKQMLPPFKAFVGGPIGNGRQWFSWVHLDDVIGILGHALVNESVKGPVNVTAPNPVTNKEFSHSLGRALHRPSFLPVPPFALFILFGGSAEILVTGQKVLPQVAMTTGYKFKFAEIDQALVDLCS